MDHLLSLFYRIIALLEELQREQGVPLGPVRLGALQSLITAFCNLAINSSLGTDLQPALVERESEIGSNWNCGRSLDRAGSHPQKSVVKG